MDAPITWATGNQGTFDADLSDGSKKSSAPPSL